MSKQSEYYANQLNCLICMSLEYSDKLTLELIDIHIKNHKDETDRLIREVLYEDEC